MALAAIRRGGILARALGALVAVALAAGLFALLFVRGTLGVDDWVLLDESLAEGVKARTNGRGTDLVLDLVGGEWTGRALEAMTPRGRLVLVGLTAGASATIDLANLLRRIES